MAENLFLTREPVGRLGRIDKKRMHREAAALFAGMGVRIDPAEEVRNLKTSQKQLLEIAKALRGKAKLIILDEPTTALNTQEVDHLFAILRRLKEQNGTSFLFISHKMPEVFAFADRYTVLSDGRFVAEGAIADTTPETITEQMVGHPAGQGAQDAITSLSGGNQQKVFLARWLNTGAGILLLDNPTQGIDVGAKEEIYALILELAGQGKTILINTLEIPELQKVADRCAVFYEGRLVRMLPHEEINENTVMLWSTGASCAKEETSV